MCKGQRGPMMKISILCRYYIFVLVCVLSSLPAVSAAGGDLAINSVNLRFAPLDKTDQELWPTVVIQFSEDVKHDQKALSQMCRFIEIILFDDDEVLHDCSDFPSGVTPFIATEACDREDRIHLVLPIRAFLIGREIV